MDSMDKYIERLSDPVVRDYWRKINLQDYEAGPTPYDGSRLNEEEVREAEKLLGFALPPSYRKLLTSTEPYDGHYGVTWPNNPSLLLEQEPWIPPFLFGVVYPDDGDAYCFDLRHPDERGEYPIVHFDHENHTEKSTEFEPVAKDLGEFLLRSLGGESGE